jgi:predicted transposase YbfD/YdcC
MRGASVGSMGCQPDVARKIKDKEAGYIPAVKGNQPTFEEGRIIVRFHKPFDYREEYELWHWRIDVAFGEDLSRKRPANAAHNFNIVRKNRNVYA